MPIYEYQSEAPEDPERSCFSCRKPFELRRSMSRSGLLCCPLCKNPLLKLVSVASVATNKSHFTVDKAKRAGFSVLENMGDGVIEKL